jgi:hypothetical protein
MDPLAHFVCELAFGHKNDHVAFAVASDEGDKWWWQRLPQLNCGMGGAEGI